MRGKNLDCDFLGIDRKNAANASMDAMRTYGAVNIYFR